MSQCLMQNDTTVTINRITCRKYAWTLPDLVISRFSNEPNWILVHLVGRSLPWGQNPVPVSHAHIWHSSLEEHQLEGYCIWYGCTEHEIEC
jgi:hypothetical protein